MPGLATLAPTCGRTPRGRGRSRRAVEAAGEARRLVGADRELFEDADAGALAPGGPDELLDVEVLVVERVEVGEGPGLGVDGQLTVPRAVVPLGMQVAEAEHLEGEDRRQLDALGVAPPRR